MKANLAILGGLFLSCDVKSFTIFIIMFTHLLWLQTNWFVYRTFTHVWQIHPCDCIRWARTFFFIAWIKPFSLILMYFNIDHNCFVNQLYHKRRLFAKKEQLAKRNKVTLILFWRRVGGCISISVDIGREFRPVRLVWWALGCHVHKILIINCIGHIICLIFRCCFFWLNYNIFVCACFFENRLSFNMVCSFQRTWRQLMCVYVRIVCL